MINSGIIGTGSYVPLKKLDNYELSKICKLPSKEILKKTGIKFRRIASSEETASSMGYKASLSAIKNSKIKKNDISMVICCTFSGEYIYPAG